MYKKLTYLILLICLSSSTVAQKISPSDTSTEYSIRGTFYHDRFVGRKTSSGEVFRQDKFTAAHRHLKFGTLLLVTNPKNGKQVIVKINDRCPKDKILDMTRRAVNSLGIKSATVSVRVLPPRYMAIWEQQDQLKDVLDEGRLMEYAHKFLAENKSIEDFIPAPSNNPAQLYDIELMRGILSYKNNSIDMLPIYLQDKVEILNINNGKGQKMILFISLPYHDATKILTSLKAQFPHATLIEAQ